MAKALIVHGGAWGIPDELVADHRAACLAAVKAGWRVLCDGGTALDAVEQAILGMEDDPALDAGIGSFLNANGEVELDAGLMNGTTLAVGSVAAVRGIRHPITLARKVMESEHVLLVGSGAETFAERHGVERCPADFFAVSRELERWERTRREGGFQVRSAFARSGDTVGAVALDDNGQIVAATSTGGTPHKHPGRVGDSPLVGSGFYADSALGGASCTGWGEGIMRVVLAKAAVDRLAFQGPTQVAEWAVSYLAHRVGGLGGIILVNCQGQVGYAYNTPRMAYAYLSEDLERPIVGI